MHWSAPNSLIRSYLQPCINSIWGDESEAVAPIIWLYQTVDAPKEEVFFPNLLITLQSHDHIAQLNHQEGMDTRINNTMMTHVIVYSSYTIECSVTITMILYEHHGVSNHQQPDWLFNDLLRITTNKTSALLDLLWGKPPIDQCKNLLEGWVPRSLICEIW